MKSDSAARRHFAWGNYFCVVPDNATNTMQSVYPLPEATNYGDGTKFLLLRLWPRTHNRPWYAEKYWIPLYMNGDSDNGFAKFDSREEAEEYIKLVKIGRIGIQIIPVDKEIKL